MWRTVQKLQELYEERLCSHKHDFGISAPCDGIGGAVKTTCSQNEKLEIKKLYEGGDPAPVTWNSHHLVRFLSSRNGPKRTSKDESYVDIQSISLNELCIQLILVFLASLV